MTMVMNNGASKNGRLPRPTLSGQIDRLDGILDGLAEALNESVADAVRGVVRQAVRESVEEAVREVLSDPQLLREAMALHAPVAAVAPPQKRTLRSALAGTVGWLCALAAGRANDAATVLGWGWRWCVKKVSETTQALALGWNAAAAALPWLAGLAWKHPGTCAVALGVGTVLGVMAYCMGPVVASALVGLGGAAVSLGGSLLAAACRPFGGD